MWDIVPRMDLLKTDEKNQAYLAAKAGEAYLIYFTKPGIVKLDLTSYDKTFEVKWIDIENAEWENPDELIGGKIVELVADNQQGSCAILVGKQ